MEKINFFRKISVFTTDMDFIRKVWNFANSMIAEILIMSTFGEHLTSFRIRFWALHYIDWYNMEMTAFQSWLRTSGTWYNSDRFLKFRTNNILRFMRLKSMAGH